MKVLKKDIQKALKSLEPTQIFKIAKLNGIDVINKSNVYDFIREHAKTKKVYNSAYKIAYDSHYLKQKHIIPSGKNTTIKGSIIAFARLQKSEGISNYTKVLTVGNSNIYWTHPLYLHSDYNKSIAFPNTEPNRKLSALINKFLGF